MEKMHVVAEILVHFDPSDEEGLPYVARVRTAKHARELTAHGCRAYARGRSGTDAIEALSLSWKRCGFLQGDE